MSRALLVRPALEDERPAVLSAIRAAYAEFEPAVTAPEWVRMSGNLAGIVAPGSAGVLIAAFATHASGATTAAGTAAGAGQGTDAAGVAGPKLVGTVTYLPPGPREYNRVPTEWAVIRGMAVVPAWRGHGIARALLTDCLDRARSDAAPAVGLHTAAIFHAARRLYEDAGFVQQSEFDHLGLRFCIYALDLPTAS
ncbi:MAG: GNAT family N-acetyltransferase [Geodermatophilaceae bacterium]|nr:GNAT family N-acetyltransferase [Geodermatophilaceae bacterium]